MSARESALNERVVLVARVLAESEIPIAFGCALALAYYGEPRATIDIDLNVFVTVDRVADVLEIVRPLGVDATDDHCRELETTGQGRLRWGRYSLDLFFSTHALHRSCAARVRRVPFAGEEIPILSSEDLVVFKVLFKRPKDWLDIEQLLFAQAGTFDIGYVEHWMSILIDLTDRRFVRLSEALRNASGTS